MTSTSDRSSTSPDRVIEEIYRADWGRVLSLLVSRSRRIDLAEDALSEAFARASARWAADGVPANPTGWLYRTAHRQILGRLRAEAIAGRKAPLLAVSPQWVSPAEPLEHISDERLQLILLCCHPALPRQSRSALALRLVLGTSTEQIARLFLVSRPTMAARITRAKRKIVLAGIPLTAPLENELTTRLDEVCRTLYLAFTAGYTPGLGSDLLRSDLAGEAVRLASVLHELVPEAKQVQAMRALLMLQHSRRDARQRNGKLVTLPDQDRTAWHHDEVQVGLGLVDGLEPGDGYGEELRLQAVIAAEHARPATATATNWRAIVGHYADLETRTRSAIVRLNRAVAVAEVDGPQAGLDILAGLDNVLPDNHRVAAIRADLAQRAGDTVLAKTSYRQALDLCGNDVERAHLAHRLDALDAHPL